MLNPEDNFIIASRVIRVYTYPEINYYEDLESYGDNVIRLAQSQIKNGLTAAVISIL
jgi:hypothetical protein